MSDLSIELNPLVERKNSFSDQAMSEVMNWTARHEKDLKGMAMFTGMMALSGAGIIGFGKLMDLAINGTEKQFYANLNRQALNKVAENVVAEPVFKPTFELSKLEVDALSLPALAERANFETATRIGFLRDRLIMEDFSRPYQAGSIDIHTYHTLSEYSGQAWRSLPEVHVPGVNGVRLADDFSVRPIGTKQLDWSSIYAQRRRPLVQQLSASF